MSCPYNKLGHKIFGCGKFSCAAIAADRLLKLAFETQVEPLPFPAERRKAITDIGDSVTIKDLHDKLNEVIDAINALRGAK